jgi:hypothetical protein
VALWKHQRLLRTDLVSQSEVGVLSDLIQIDENMPGVSIRPVSLYLTEQIQVAGSCWDRRERFSACSFM